MRKYLVLLVSFFSCFLMGQESASFHDYLSHCKKMTLPFEITHETLKNIFPKIGKRDTEVPVEYIRRFICGGQSPCDDQSDYRYDYGVQIQEGNLIFVILNKICYSCYTALGEGSAGTLMLIYTLDGKLLNAESITRDSDEHFSECYFFKEDVTDSILSVRIMQGTVITLLESTGKSDIYQCKLDYFIYSVNDKGIISCKKVKTEKAKVELNPSDNIWWRIIEKEK